MSAWTPPEILPVPEPEPTPVPTQAVAVLTGDDTVIAALSNRFFGDRLRAAALFVVIATNLKQAKELGKMPILVTADCAQMVPLLVDGKRSIIGVCSAIPDGTYGCKWVDWPQSSEGWIELLALAVLRANFASTSQMLATRRSK